MSTKMDMKKMLLDAFTMERKAQDMYDMVWAELSESQKQNVQKTLIGIIFLGDEGAFKEVNEQYRTDKTKLKPNILKDIQCFHRTAMAFSRRQKKEQEDVSQIDSVLNMINTVVNASTEGTTANTVSGDSTEGKKKRKSKPAKAENPEALIQKAISLITRDDVKVLLQQALIQMKLTITQHKNAEQTFITPFEVATNTVSSSTSSDSDVWW